MQLFKKLHFKVQSIRVLMRNMYLSRQWMLPVEVNMWSQQSLRFEVCMCRRHVGMAKYAHQRHHGRVPGRAARGHLVRAEDESLQQRRLREPEHSICNTGLRRQWVRDSFEGTVWLNCSVLLSVLVRKSHRLSCWRAQAQSHPSSRPSRRTTTWRSSSPLAPLWSWSPWAWRCSSSFARSAKKRGWRGSEVRREREQRDVSRKYRADTIRIFLCSDKKVKCVFHLNIWPVETCCVGKSTFLPDKKNSNSLN